MIELFVVLPNGTRKKVSWSPVRRWLYKVWNGIVVSLMFVWFYFIEGD